MLHPNTMRKMLHKSIVSAKNGSVSIEFALVFLFFIMPLTLLSIDSIYLILGREQLAQVAHSLYIFAWDDPNEATNVNDLNSVIAQNDQSIIGQVALVQTPDQFIECLQNDGTSTPSDNGFCTSGTAETFVSYYLSFSVQLPITSDIFQNSNQINMINTIRIK